MKELRSIDIYGRAEIDGMPRGTDASDPTAEIVLKRNRYIKCIEMVNRNVKIAGGEISEYLFKAVTEGMSFPALEAIGIPCGRDYFYERYRRYFFFLDRDRE